MLPSFIFSALNAQTERESVTSLHKFSAVKQPLNETLSVRLIGLLRHHVQIQDSRPRLRKQTDQYLMVYQRITGSWTSCSSLKRFHLSSSSDLTSVKLLTRHHHKLKTKQHSHTC